MQTLVTIGSSHMSQNTFFVEVKAGSEKNILIGLESGNNISHHIYIKQHIYIVKLELTEVQGRRVHSTWNIYRYFFLFRHLVAVYDFF